MAKRAKETKEIRRTIRLKFLTDTGKTHTISLNCASAELAGAEGSARVKRVMEKILEYDVFTVKLVKVIGAELVERRTILTYEDLHTGEGYAETEAISEVYEDRKRDEATYSRLAAAPGQTQVTAAKNWAWAKQAAGPASGGNRNL